MSETVKCKAIVLSVADYNENDRMLTAVSDEFGKISISVRGAKKPNSRFVAVCQQFCYSEMELRSSKNGIYTLCEAELINSFYNLRNDLDVLTVSNEIAKTVLKVSQEELPDVDLLRLLLNTLYVLCREKPEIRLIKSIFNIRLVFDQGYLNEPHVRQNATFLAIEHIIRSDFKNLFSFGVSPEVLNELEGFSEKCIFNLLNS